MHPLLIALQFLTRLPLPSVQASPDIIGRSLLYYPAVGLLIGALLAGLGWLLQDSNHLISAALLLAAWVMITGGLHLDGLADSADAWLGGYGNRKRTLEIMKDPACGPAGVIALLLVLLLKFVSLASLFEHGDWQLLILAPLLGRTALPLLFLTTPYVRPGGLGSTLAEHLPRRSAWIISVGVLLAVGILAPHVTLAPLLVCAAMFLILRTQMTTRIGGTTGDTAGAMVEIMEMTVLTVIGLSI